MCIQFSDACKILNLIYFPHFADANITCSVIVLLLPVVSPALVDLSSFPPHHICRLIGLKREMYDMSR